MKNILLKFTLFGLLIISLSACFDYKNVDFKGMEGFNIEERTDDGIIVRLDVKVDNPNTYNIKVKKSTVDLYLNKKYLGKAKIKKNVKIKKQEEAIYPVYIKTSGKDLMQSAMGSISTLMSGNINIGVKGNVKASVYGIGKKFPIDMEENVNLKSLGLF